MGSKKIKFKTTLKRLIAIASFLFLVSYYDPFGIDPILLKHSNNLFYHIFSPKFNTIHDDTITVILLRENELEKGWPPSYEYHADILTSILDNQPKAIFIDLLFESTDKNEIAYLKEVLKATNIPVYLAVGRERGLSNAFFNTFFDFPINSVNYTKKHNELNNVIPTSIVIYSKQGIKYPMTNLSDKLLHKNGNNSIYSTKLILSLPAQLYCNDKYNITSAQQPEEISNKEKKCVQNFIKEHGNQNFYITWRDMFSDDTGSPIGNQCRELPTSVSIRLLNIFVLNIFNSIKSLFAYKPTQLEKQTCLSHQTLSVTHLLYDADRSGVESLIKDKYVFYGVKLENTNDIISPPTHNALPGIYAHTMALENYLTYQQEMIVDDKKLPVLNFISLKAFWSILICLSLAFFNEYSRFIYVKARQIVKQSKKTKKTKKTFITKFPPSIVTLSISIIYLVFIVLWIILIAMIIPFQIFAIAPLSGFDFVIAVGFINLPSIITWWTKKLDELGLGESFNH